MILPANGESEVKSFYNSVPIGWDFICLEKDNFILIWANMATKLEFLKPNDYTIKYVFGTISQICQKIYFSLKNYIL